VILLFIYSIFGFYIDYKIISYKTEITYYSVALITVALIASIIVTIYFINNFILDHLKYDRLKMTYAIDAMTDTLNRGSGFKFIEDQLEICKKLNQNLTICYIDINDLKVINDMLGHRKGDELIKTIVGTVKENIRESDVISRLGGDEFVIVLPDCDIEYGEKIMKKISDKLEHLKLFNSDYTISISYGFSEYKGNNGATVDSLLDQADYQMYMNKRASKAMV
jgi:diguanylate cyclase (GGDEF)-like protein